MPAGPTRKMSVLRELSSEEMRAHNCGERVKIEECEKINRTELAIDCRWAADLGANRQIGMQQFG